MPWRKIENENGLPIYVNELTKERQWDHPEFAKIRTSLNECNYIKYSSYRVAMKLRTLQKQLFMEFVPLTLISGVFERHKLGVNENSLNLDCYDLEAILFDVFFACKTQNDRFNLNIDLATELLLNLLLNIYDNEKTGKIQVLSMKLLLGILSNSNSIEDLHRFLFESCSDHNNCVTRLKLQNLLKKLCELISFLHEDANFGPHLINSSIDNCFSTSPGLVGVTETNFIAWLDQNPQIITWLPTLNRIKSSENVVQKDEVCSTCRIESFHGLLYKCLKCKRFTQCQQCFFNGKTISNGLHKLSHPVREFRTKESGKNDDDHNNNSVKKRSTILKKLFDMLACNRKSEMTQPLRNSYDDDDKKSLASDGVDYAPLPLTQLRNVIRDLERQNRDLSNLLDKRTTNQMKNYLRNHQSEVGRQINKLKVLKEYLSSPTTATTEEFEIVSPSKASVRNHRSRRTLEDNRDPRSVQRIDENDQRLKNSDLDDALAKLQQILANNFSLNETLCNTQQLQQQQHLSNFT